MSSATGHGRQPLDRRFWLLVVAIALVGTGLRLGYLATFAPPMPALSDTFWFQVASDQLIKGNGFRVLLNGHYMPSAIHPPLYVLWLVVWKEVGLHSDEALRATGAVLSMGTITLTGAVGRAVGGAWVGIAAAAVVAIHPLLVATDMTLLSEPLYAAVVAGALLCAVKLRETRGAAWAVTLGVCLGLATLTRSEAVFLIPLLGLAAVWGGSRWVHWRGFGIVAVCAALTISPWAIRNWSEFGRPLLSTNYGNLIGATNNQAAYYDSRVIGGLGSCQAPPTKGEVAQADYCAKKGERYAVRHFVRWPVVVPFRVMRAWSLWAPFNDTPGTVGRSGVLQDLGIALTWVLMLLSVPGAIALRRARGHLAVLLAPIVFVIVVAALTYGTARLRIPGDLALSVLAANGLAAIAARYRTGRASPVPDRSPASALPRPAG